MNRSLIKTLIAIWTAIAVIGICFLIYGLLYQGNFNIFKFNNTSASYRYKIQQDEKVSIDNLNKIDLDFYGADVFINVTDEADLKVVQSSTGTLKDKDKFVITKNNGELGISTSSKTKVVQFHIFEFKNIKQKIEVYIPRKYSGNLYVSSRSGDVIFNFSSKLDNIHCDQASGDITVKDSITGNNVNLKTRSGDINLETIYSKNYSIEDTSGDIRINSIYGSGYIKNVSGDINIDYKEIDDYSQIYSVSGDIKLKVPENLNFKFNGQCTNGDINSDFQLNYENSRKSKASLQIGNGLYKTINAKAVSGDINLYR